MVSRAQEAYSGAQAHANSFESTGSANEPSTANHMVGLDAAATMRR